MDIVLWTQNVTYVHEQMEKLTYLDPIQYFCLQVLSIGRCFRDTL